MPDLLPNVTQCHVYRMNGFVAGEISQMGRIGAQDHTLDGDAWMKFL